MSLSLKDREERLIRKKKETAIEEILQQWDPVISMNALNKAPY